MSLISQNANSQNKDKIKYSMEPSGSELNGVPRDSEDSEPVYRKKKRKKEPKNESIQSELLQQMEMKKLETFLFGSLYAPVEFGKENEKVQSEKGSALFFTDHSADNTLTQFKEDTEKSIIEDEDSKQRKPVWIDEEEEIVTVDISKVNRLRKLRKEENERLISATDYVSRLRAQHAKMNPGTEWAQPDYKFNENNFSDDDSNVETHAVLDAENMEGILRTDEDLVVKSTTKLSPGLLEYSRLVNANAEEPSNAPITSVQFHQNGQLLLTAGLDKRISFFQIDGKRNTKIQSIFLEDCPIRKAAFLPNGTQVIISGRRKFFYCFDLMKATVDKVGPLIGRDEKSLEAFEVSPDSRIIAFLGNDGYILLVSSQTKELIGTLKMNGTVNSLSFADDGKTLVSFGGDGHIYHWDLRTGRCFHKGIVEGCVNGTAVCASPRSTLMAAGCSTGVVNVYNRKEFLGGKREPRKAIDNLSTRIDCMKFNSDAQVLAISSRMDKNSLKLIHVPSFRVFSNWPPMNKSLNYPMSFDFSPGGGFMALGNASGKVLLYKLHHYQHA